MAGDTSLPNPGDLVAAKYRIERQIGAGGMGAVFEATHRVTGKRFAVKWLLPDMSEHADAAKRFIREAQVAGRFEHPNVVEVYDVGQERGSFYMVMELLLGESLADRLLRTPKLTPEEACRLLVPCMRGVSRAHSSGIVHRDLKPANVFLCHATPDSPEVPKVLDFGISKMSNLSGEVDSSITKTGMVMGTPHYMSPEQVRGRAVDHRADVYAFGVILYQVLSGQLPFPADTFSELVLQIATETPKPLGELARSVPPDLVAIINKAMARDPADRYQDLESLIKAMAPYATGRSIQDSAARAIRIDSARPRGVGARDTVPLDTPLSTESNSFHAPPSTNRGLFWMVAAAAVAVVALGVIISQLLPSDKANVNAASAGQPKSAETAKPTNDSPQAAAAEPAAAATEPGAEPVANTGNEEPHPTTVRLTAEPEQRPRTWEPPPGYRPVAPQTEEPVVAPTSKPDKRDADRGHATKRHGRADGKGSSNPPAPSPSNSDSSKPAGRLGIEMTEHEF